MRDQGGGGDHQRIIDIVDRGTPDGDLQNLKRGGEHFTQHLAWENAKYGVRANAILPGLIDTPMAIERRAKEQGVERDVVRETRQQLVPLQTRVGTAWDVANAALFLASEEAGYITGVLLPVDGGLLVKVG